MEDSEFVDRLYQGWSQTTGAADTYWQPIKSEVHNGWMILAVGEEEQQHVATSLAEADAGWITALHGCFGDLVRRLHIALDLAEQKDVERDQAQLELAAVAIENMELQKTIEGLSQEIRFLEGNAWRSHS